MTDERKINIAIPTWNRFEMTVNSFASVLYDDRVSTVCITDDASTDNSYWQLVNYFKDNDKVLLFRNEFNMDCYTNKRQSMLNSVGQWNILLDSDNKIRTDYLDALYDIPKWDSKTIYLPDFASPHFSAKQWSGLILTKENVAQYIDTHLMTNLNAMNFFINREEYLKIWDGSVDPVTSDSIYFSYCWLKAGNKIYVTPNLQYEHYISPNNDGHYQTNYQRTGNFHEELMDKIRNLR